MTNSCLQIVVMGVASTGKTVVARRLAGEFGIEYVEGDDYHPQANIEKMATGIPLTDADRLPWLAALADLIERSHNGGKSSIVTCSALRRSYRDILRGTMTAHSVFFVHLNAGFDLLHARMLLRTGHFMPTALLKSQLDTLEPLAVDEDGAAIDISPPLDLVVAQAAMAIRSYADAHARAPRLCLGSATRGG
jgi:gluconokinase